MCWCQPSMRTPCCGRPECHAAALKAGALKPGETCSFCHPPQRAKPPPAPAKRETTQEIRIETTTRCPRCARSSHLKSILSEVEIQGWNVVGIQVRAREDRKRFEEDLERRGWTDEMCGQCRDRDAGEAPLSLEAVLEAHAARVGEQQAIDDFDAVLTRFVARGKRPRPGSGAERDEA